MTEQQPVSVINTTIEGRTQSIPVFGIDQIIRARLGQEVNKNYEPIPKISSPELQRARYEMQYLYHHIDKYTSQTVVKQALETVRKEFATQLSKTKATDIAAGLATRCSDIDTPPSLAQLAAQLKLLESLNRIPINTNYQDNVDRIKTQMNEVAFQCAEEGFLRSAEVSGIQAGAASKILEYTLRTTKTRQEKAKQMRQYPPTYHNEPDVSAQLSQFSGFDYDKLTQFREKYQVPSLSKFISPEAKLNMRQLAEFALVTRATPVSIETSLASQQLKLSTNDTSGELRICIDNSGRSFAADKLLLAVLTSQENTTLLYPHTNSHGKIESTTLINVTPTQRYLIERKAREVLAKKGALDQLYPTKVVPRDKQSITNVTQNKDRSITVQDANDTKGKFGLHYENGLLNFPIDRSHTIDVMYTSADNVFAQYSNLADAFIVGTLFLENMRQPDIAGKLSNKERAMLVARHELNHGVWNKLPPDDKKKIRDSFTLTNPRFKKFAENFTADDEYRTNAILDLKIDPTAETIEVNYNGSLVKIAKNRVVDELLAYATCDEVVSGTSTAERQSRIQKNRDLGVQHMKAKGGLIPPATLASIDNGVRLMVSSIDCIQASSQEVRDMLKSKLLMIGRDSTYLQDFFDAFTNVITTLNDENIQNKP